MEAIVKNGGVVNEGNLEGLLKHASVALFRSLSKYVEVAKACSANKIIFVMDLSKEDAIQPILFQKGRKDPPNTLQEKKKVSCFLQSAMSPAQGTQKASKTNGEARRGAENVLASHLFSTAEGLGVVRSVLLGAVRQVPVEHNFAVEFVGCREADFLCLNNDYTAEKGVLAKRETGVGVLVFTLDGDLGTQIPHGEGSLNRTFVQIVISGMDVRIRTPRQLFQAVLSEICKTLVCSVPIVQLYLGYNEEEDFHMTVEQKFCLLLMTGPAMGDYSLRKEESRFLKDQEGVLPTEPYFQLLRAFYGWLKLRKCAVSFLSLIECLQNCKISYFEQSAARKKQKLRLERALRSVDSQIEIFYAGLCRSLTMFPFGLWKEKMMLQYLNFWTGLPEVLSFAELNGWLKAARDCNFSVVNLLQESDADSGQSMSQGFFKGQFWSSLLEITEEKVVVVVNFVVLK